MKLLSQRDPRWARGPLGWSDETIGAYGCAVTALAMLINALRGNDDLDPAQVNGILKSAGAIGGPYRNYVIWPNVPQAFPDLAWRGRIYCRGLPATPQELGEIDTLLARGLPVIIEVDLSPKVRGYQQHFVLITGRQKPATRLDNYIIADPWDWQDNPDWKHRPEPLCPQYGPKPAIAVCGILLYERARPA